MRSVPPLRPLLRRVAKDPQARLVAASYVPLALSFLVSPLIARGLGVIGRGTLASVQIYNEATTAIFRMGMPEAGGYFARRDLAGERSINRVVIRWGLLMMPISVIVAGLLLVGPLRSLDPGVKVVAFVVMAWTPLVDTVGLLWRNLLMARADYTGLARFSPIASLFTGLWILACFLVGELTTVTVLVGTALAAIISYGYARLRLRPLREGEPARLGPLLRFGVKAMPASLASFVGGRLDMLLVLPLLGRADLGYYAVANTVNSLVTRLGFALSMPAFSEVGRRDGIESMHHTQVAIRRSFLASAALAALIGLVTPIALPFFFGEPFRPAVALTLLLLPGSIALSSCMVAWQAGNALGRPDLATQSQVAGLIAGVVLMPAAIAWGGLSALAVASSITYVVRLGWSLMILKRHARRTWPELSAADR